MSNPRKFSEKIALQNRKLVEEQNAFENIMREVTQVKGPPVESASLNLPYSPNIQSTSLPNVHQWAQYPMAEFPMQQPPDLFGAYPPGTSYARASDQARVAAHYRHRSPDAGAHYHHHHPYQHVRGTSPHLHTSGSISPGRAPLERQLQNQAPFISPPYRYGAAVANANTVGGGGAYFLEPPDSSWPKKFHSDPQIHASLLNVVRHPDESCNNGASPSHSPTQGSPAGVSHTTVNHVDGSFVTVDSSGAMQMMRPGSAGNPISMLSADISAQSLAAPPQGANNSGSLPDLSPSSGYVGFADPNSQINYFNAAYPSALGANAPGTAVLVGSGAPANMYQQQYYSYAVSQQPSQTKYNQQSIGSPAQVDAAASPGSPAGAYDTSPVASPPQQQPCSPGSSAQFQAMHAQMQGLHFAQGDAYGGQYYSNQAQPADVYASQQYSPQQMSSALNSVMTAGGESSHRYNSATLSPTQSGQIPNIVFTNFDDTGSGVLHENCEAEDLKNSLDLNCDDLNELLESSSPGIDEGFEDALRREAPDLRQNPPS